ncbi:hypothetical protein ANCCAN_00994, partial [Ancylostoma caninum]
MPEVNTLYSEGPKETLNVKAIVRGWKHRLQLMSHEKKFGCTVLLGQTI